MPEDEVDIGDEEDYEVVPVGPIRRLEKRIDNIESQAVSGGGASDDMMRDVLDIMKSNQKIVNDMTESTHELKNNVEDLTHKMDEVVDNMNEFMDLLEEASKMDLEGEVVGDMQGRIADAVASEMEDVAADLKQSNQQVVSSLEEINKSLKRSYASQNKDEILGRQRSGEGNTRRGGSGQSRKRSQGQRSGNQNAQSRSSNEGQSDSRDERMRNLRKRFEQTEEQ